MLYTLACVYVYNTKNMTRRKLYQHMNNSDFMGIKSEKMSVVGQLVGRSKKIHPDDVYQCMLDINDIGDKITWSKIAELLKCSERTIIRNINNELKKEKLLLNKQL